MLFRLIITWFGHGAGAPTATSYRQIFLGPPPQSHDHSHSQPEAPCLFSSIPFLPFHRRRLEKRITRDGCSSLCIVIFPSLCVASSKPAISDPFLLSSIPFLTTENWVVASRNINFSFLLRSHRHDLPVCDVPRGGPGAPRPAQTDALPSVAAVAAAAVFHVLLEIVLGGEKVNCSRLLQR